MCNKNCNLGTYLHPACTGQVGCEPYSWSLKMDNMNSCAKTEQPKVIRGRAHRVLSADFSIAEEVFKAAMFLATPEDHKQRKAFETLMPYLFVLRNQGWSWEQLTKLLNDCGFKLQLPTVRRYFGELKKVNLAIYQQEMNAHILRMNEVEKQTRGGNISAISGRVASILNGV